MFTTMNDTYVGGSRRSLRRTTAQLLRKLHCRAMRILVTFFVWQERVNQRHRLMEMNDHMLRDIGISRADAQREYGKPFWRG